MQIDLKILPTNQQDLFNILNRLMHAEDGISHCQRTIL
jgi:hypothetical protein